MIISDLEHLRPVPDVWYEAPFSVIIHGILIIFPTNLKNPLWLIGQVDQMIAARRGRAEESPHSLEQDAG